MENHVETTIKNTNSIMAGLMVLLGLVTGWTVLIAVLALARAFVFIKLWNWFVVPILGSNADGMPPLTYPLAIGLSLVASMFTASRKPDAEPWKLIGHGLCSLAILFFMAWIVHLFV